MFSHAQDDYYAIINPMNKESLEDYFEHTNMDYPVGVYYMDLDGMYMRRVRAHWHPEMEIDLVREGSAVFSIGGESFPVNAGNAVWINQDRLHMIHPADPGVSTVILSILFHPAYLFEQNDSFLATKYCEPLKNNEGLSHLILSRDDEYGVRALENINTILETNLKLSFGYELETKSRLCALWLQLLEKSSRIDFDTDKVSQATIDETRVKEALIYMHSAFSSKVTLDMISDSIHVSKSECCRCFKRSLGMSPFDLLLEQRIYEAARRLQRSEKKTESMQDLAMATGFPNPSYFNRIFKKFLECTPREYREHIKKGHRDALNPYGIPLTRL